MTATATVSRFDPERAFSSHPSEQTDNNYKGIFVIHRRRVGLLIHNKHLIGENVSTNLMIDIETLGTSKNSVILSIGAVQFSEKGVEKKFYVQVDPTSCTDWGLQIDARTVMWWLDQSDEARKALSSSKGEAIDVALDMLIAEFKWKDVIVWANGIDFDFTILEEAMKATGRAVPWAYWSKMDYRTVKNLAPRDVYNACKVENPVAHNALADATAQAATLINLQQALSFGMPVAAKKKKAA